MNHFLRCMHNLALGLGWLPWPIIPTKLWPAVEEKAKRAITFEEHQRILQSKHNPERRLYYEMLWEIGAAQSDAAMLTSANIHWADRLLSFQRQKTGEWAYLRIGSRLEAILKQLPSDGPLFPTISKTNASARSSEFCRRCRVSGVNGVSLHSYRYSWAERAKASGYPERWAQEALGHNSRAVHNAYAKNAKVQCPPLEEYENKIVPLPPSPKSMPDASHG